jgi:ADP-heptose:LPS heptosyltransferase
MRFPSAHIAVWCKAYTKPVAMMFPTLDQTYAADPFWDRSPLRGKGKVLPYLRSLFAVRRDRYDTAIVVTSHWRAPASALAAGIPVRIGRQHRHNRRFLTHVLPREDRTQLAVLDLGRLLHPLGISEVPTHYRLDPAPLAERQRRLAPRVGVKPLAAVHPFAGSSDRCLPVADWIRVATSLPAIGLTPLWLGSTSELRVVRAAAGSSPGWLFADELGDDSIGDLAALIALSAIYLGHDSGPLHVASALGIPVVGVYMGTSDPRRTGPHGTGTSHVIDVRQDSGDPAARILGAAATLWR